MTEPKITLHHDDLPDSYTAASLIAVDCEMTGLQTATRDRLCLVQLSNDGEDIHLIQIAKDPKPCPNLRKVLEAKECVKMFHFARGDIAVLKKSLNIDCAPVYCTKIASNLTRTYSNKHGLAATVDELLGIKLDKMQQTTDWAVDELTEEQIKYAAQDVRHLHAIKAALDKKLIREGRMDWAQNCFNFLATRAALDLNGWENTDIFAHH